MTMQSQPLAPRSRRKQLILGAMAVLLVILVVLRFVGQPFEALRILALSLGAVIAALSAFWIATLDEMERHAHYQAWYWGGSIGVLVAGGMILAVAFGGVAAPTLPLVGADANAGFLSGAILALVMPAVGYTIWWLSYWLRHR